MSLVFTENPRGDILVISKLISDIIRSLKEVSSLTSVEEDLISSLKSLKTAVELVNSVLQLFDTVPGRPTSKSLPARVHHVLVECRQDLRGFLHLQHSGVILPRVLTLGGSDELTMMLNLVEKRERQFYLCLGKWVVPQLLELARGGPLSDHRTIENMHIPAVSIRESVSDESTVDIESQRSSWSGAGARTSFARLQTCSPNTLE